MIFRLQLLMKHISKLFWFDDLIKRKQNIVTYFHKAKKRLVLLWDEQNVVYKRKTLLLFFFLLHDGKCNIVFLIHEYKVKMPWDDGKLGMILITKELKKKKEAISR